MPLRVLSCSAFFFYFLIENIIKFQATCALRTSPGNRLQRTSWVWLLVSGCSVGWSWPHFQLGCWGCWGVQGHGKAPTGPGCEHPAHHNHKYYQASRTFGHAILDAFPFLPCWLGAALTMGMLGWVAALVGHKDDACKCW